ncbi:MAG: hypothetical protein V4486_03585 [Patescibacteria group bacterium]
MIKEYIAYFKDNPKGLWFKRRLFGWGWTPVKWQGWMVILVYVVLLMKVIVLFKLNSNEGSGTPFKMIISIVILTALLIYICYRKGEKPKWSWGLDKK